MRLTLPWPPSGNTYWRHVGNRVLLSQEARRYRVEVQAALWEAKAQGEFRPLGSARLCAVATYSPPDRRRWDLDNRWKQLADALEKAGAYDDDGQIDDLRLVRGEVCKGGRVVVEIVSKDGNSGAGLADAEN